MERDLKRANAVNNEAYKERFQFLLSIIDETRLEGEKENVICQRYFRINGFNPESLSSNELFETLEECVRMIQKDLKYKSFVFQDLTNPTPIKAEGFVQNYDNLSVEDILLLVDSNVRGKITLSDGTEVNKTYIDPVTATEEENVTEEETLNPWDITFKFDFLVDEKIVYQRIWDATQYPKQIRNSVDLSNMTTITDPTKVSLNSMDGISLYLKYKRPDLVNGIIRKIVSVASGKFGPVENYTRKVSYGDKDYYLSSYDRDYVNSYYKWVVDKTRKHKRQL